MHILITGACGFIGRNLIKVLEQDHQLRLLDQTPAAEATIFAGGGGRKAVPLETQWPLLQGDITDEATMLKACEGVDAVVHLAGEPRGLPEIGVATFKANALGTFVAIDAAQRVGVKRFVCASSINAFGTFYWRLSGRPAPYDRMPLDEGFAPVPEDPYSLSKLTNEATCAAYSRAYGLTTAAFRFAGVWSQERYGQVLAEGLPPTAQWSDDLSHWVHVEDVAGGIRQALERADLPESGAYTLGAADTRCPEPTMALLEKFRPDLAATVRHPLTGRAPLLSIEKARQAFAYAPRFRLGD